MTHATKPRNRKERRAQTPTRTQPTIPLSQPSRSAPAPASTPKPKTLYEIAAERQQSFQQTSSPQTPPIRTSNNDPHTPHTTLRINPDGTLSTVPLKLSSPSGIKTSPTTSTDAPRNDAANERDPLGLIASALFLSTTLSMLHFTLDVLVHHQYRQTIAWSDIRWRTAGALPLLLLLLITTTTLLPPSRSSLQIPTRQIFFLALALLSGTYLLHVTHDATYYAVLKRAPAVGTLWVWSVVELELKWALASVLGVGAWGAWMGYGIF